jgi:hypothetical protein
MPQQDKFRFVRRGNTRKRVCPSVTVEVAELRVINGEDLVGAASDQVSNATCDIWPKGYDR